VSNHYDAAQQNVPRQVGLPGANALWLGDLQAFFSLRAYSALRLRPRSAHLRVSPKGDNAASRWLTENVKFYKKLLW